MTIHARGTTVRVYYVEHVKMNVSQRTQRMPRKQSMAAEGSLPKSRLWDRATMHAGKSSQASANTIECHRHQVRCLLVKRVYKCHCYFDLSFLVNPRV